MNAREVIWFDTFILACLEDFETSTAHSALRDPATLLPYLPDSQPDLLLDRGFTGHEHLTAFGLTNMNARLYDPAAGRFLNPDPISIADATMPRYSDADIANIINQSIITPTVKLTEHMWDIATLGKLGKDVKLYRPKTWPVKVNVADYTKAFDPSMGKIAKGLKIASKGVTVLNVTYTMSSLANDWGQSRYISAGFRLGVSLLAYGTGFIPIVGPFISTGIAVADALYGEQFYNAIEERFGN